jgi:hypothetical protein
MTEYVTCGDRAVFVISTPDNVEFTCGEHAVLFVAEKLVTHPSVAVWNVDYSVPGPDALCGWEHTELTDEGLPRRHRILGRCWCGKQHSTAEATGLNGWSSGGML